MPTTYTPQNIKHATVSVAHGNEKRIWDNTNGQPSEAYVRTLIENSLDNAEHAEQVAISAVATAEAAEAAAASAVATTESFEGRLANLEETLTGTLEIAPRDLSFVGTDDPQASWVSYADADDYLADQSELAGQTRTGYRQFMLPPDCYGITNVYLYTKRSAGADETNTLRCTLYQRRMGVFNTERTWVPLAVVESAQVTNVPQSYGPVEQFAAVEMAAAQCITDKVLQLKVELINCPNGIAKFGGFRLEYVSTARPNNLE